MYMGKAVGFNLSLLVDQHGRKINLASISEFPTGWGLREPGVFLLVGGISLRHWSLASQLEIYPTLNIFLHYQLVAVLPCPAHRLIQAYTQAVG